MGRNSKIKLAGRTARRVIKRAFEENVQMIKKELKPRPKWMPTALWRKLGKIYFKFDL